MACRPSAAGATATAASQSALTYRAQHVCKLALQQWQHRDAGVCVAAGLLHVQAMLQTGQIGRPHVCRCPADPQVTLLCRGAYRAQQVGA